ncbi:DNA repair protein RadC [Methylicorpusculum oleiharenae]|uniref:RadC family protein n=1 Tax=Methylicorpusculum oleiharenae TaxID=1338687 RepID=UPI001358A3DB|nr:DNA repair protein RadC [Methylicorpusculum oleiharenae]MCD2452905.1 DNA repair protein RadC [Methylicorpusculum oleiharenae]
MLYIQESNGAYRKATEADVLGAATALFKRHFCTGNPLTEPAKAAEYLKLQLAQYEHEVFVCVFLNSQHQVLAVDELFRGTIDGASVYPREVIKAVLQHNAAAMIVAHNHPSGKAEPSQADRTITDKLKNALALIDVKLLDHFIIGESVYSFAENGLL